MRSIPSNGGLTRPWTLFKGPRPREPRAWLRSIPPEGGEASSRTCSDRFSASHRLRLGSRSREHDLLEDLDLRLAHHPQKRSARCFVDGACKRRTTTCTRRGVRCTGFALADLARWDDASVSRAPLEPRATDSRGARSRRSGSLGRPFARSSSSSDSGGFAACRAARSPRAVVRVPFRKVDPGRSPRLPRSDRSSRSGGDERALLVPLGPRISRHATGAFARVTPRRSASVTCHCPTSTT